MRASRNSWQPYAIGLIVVGLLVLSLGGYLNTVTETVLRPILAAQAWITTRYQAFEIIFASPEEIVGLRQRNAELEAELAELQTQVIALEQQVTEVEILSTLVDFARAQPQNEYMAAAVIGQDPRPFMQYVIINRGSNDGIRRGMPVVTAEGLVGRIAAVTANAARVQLITDPAMLVNVQIQPDEVDAVLTGSITSDVFLDLIPQDAGVQPGDLILTSSLGGEYPSNILIGQINSIREEATALFQQASVQPVVDFSRLEIVLIIINFEPINLDPLLPEEQP